LSPSFDSKVAPHTRPNFWQWITVLLRRRLRWLQEGEGPAPFCQVGTIDSGSVHIASAAHSPRTALSPSASLTEAIRLHWREYLMEGTEIASLMLSICVFGTLLYSNDSPFTNYFVISRAIRSVLMGIAIAATTYLIIRSPFGRRSGAHFNPAITVTFLWLRRIHHWDAVCYVSAHFVGAMVSVAIAREIFGLRLSSAPVLYLVTLPGAYGRLPAFIAEFLLSGLLMGVVLNAANHRRLTQLSPIFVALLPIFILGCAPRFQASALTRQELSLPLSSRGCGRGSGFISSDLA